MQPVMSRFIQSLIAILPRALKVWLAPEKFSEMNLAWFVIFNTVLVNLFVGLTAFPYAYITNSPVWVHWIVGSLIATPIAALLMYLGGNGLRVNLELRAELEQAQADLQVQANQDFLTGLANRRAYTAALSGKFQAKETGFALLMIDLDGFKEINDNYGHDAGDIILEGIASRLRRWLEGREALIARLGGDEFAILLQADLEGEDHETFARKLCIFLQVPYKYAETELSIGASIGLAYASSVLNDASALTVAADIALRAAKAAGKGRVMTYRASSAAEMSRQQAV